MNLSELTKEQKQYLILGLIGAVAILGGIGFGVKLSLSSMAASKAELVELTDKIDRAKRTLSGTGKTLETLEETISRLKSHLDFIPPEQNYYSWATELVYSRGRTAGLEIESIDEIRVSGGKNDIPKNPVYFEIYSIRITARGGYAQTKAFLQDIEANLPLVRFSGLEVSKSNDPEVHDIQLFIQWPFKLNRIAKLWEDQPMRKKVVVAAAEPEEAPVKPAPKPEPVVVQAKPVSVPAPEPVAVAPVPELEQPELVVVDSEPSVDSVEGSPEPEEKDGEYDVSPLRATLDSQGSDALEPVEADAAPLVQEDPGASIQELEESIPAQPELVTGEVAAPIKVTESNGPVRYVSSGKSAKIIEKMLTEGKPKTNVSLGSFLDELVEDFNDKH